MKVSRTRRQRRAGGSRREQEGAGGSAASIGKASWSAVGGYFTASFRIRAPEIDIFQLDERLM